MKSLTTLEILKNLFSQPTAPFREGFVRAEIARILTGARIPYFFDTAGNLIAGVRDFKEIRKAGFRVALMAHMDHPGFHLGEKLDAFVYRCHWYGGAPWSGMSGQAVRVHDVKNSTPSVRGKILPFQKIPSGHREGVNFKVVFERDLADFSENAFGGFDFPGFRLRRDRIYTRAADDLAGCAIALGAMLDQEKSRRNGARRLLAIFTRAEEVGFVGCVDLLKRRELPEDLWLLSLEASRALPGAKIGKGPVLRVGDKVCLFDSEFSALLLEAARALERHGDFRFQRRLMDGGTCEATPLSLMGYTVTALAIPLLNYHNGGPGNLPAAEAISLSDADQARRLCFALSRLLNSRPKWRACRIREIDSYHRHHRRRLYKNVFNHFRLQGEPRS